MSKTRAEAAIAYAAGESPLGIAVPVVPMDPATKVPLIRSWGGGAAPTTPDDVRRAWERNPDASIGVVLRSTELVVLDVEGFSHGFDLEGVMDELHKSFGPLPTTLTASSQGGGRHLYFRLPAGLQPDAVPVGLVDESGAKVAGVDIRRGSASSNGGLIIVPADLTGASVDGRAWEDLAPIATLPETLVREASRNPARPAVSSGPVAEGQRHNWLVSQAGYMRYRGFPKDAIREALLITNEQMCHPPMSRHEVVRIAHDIAERYMPGPLALGGAWPEPIRPEAFDGIAGRFVEAMAPYSEADPVALLLSFLTAFGSVVGPGPYIAIGADHHGPRIWPVFVGETAAGRKGTSLSPVLALFDMVDDTWPDRRASNVGSGEVIIHEVRDPVRELTSDGTLVIKDSGVDDKRLFIVESEFSSILTVTARDGSVLSPVLRVAWDGGTLRHTVKRGPAKATDPHITVLGHITPDEIRKNLSAVEKANGFANRFLFAMVRRSRLLPRAAALPDGLLEELVEPLRQFVDTARSRRLVQPTETYWAVYEPQYERLSSPPPGLAGAMLGRAAPYVHRLALIYALLDGESLMYGKHARSALAVWDYCAASVQHLFEGPMGSSDDDKVLDSLRQAVDGLTRTQIRDLLGKRRRGEEVEALKDRLMRAGRISVEMEATGGAAAERWRLAEGGLKTSVASVVLPKTFQEEVAP